MKILLSTFEGWPKDKKPENKKKFEDKRNYLTFSGADAPVKAARALIQKYGITPEELQEKV
jgi:hypothetical protein